MFHAQANSRYSRRHAVLNLALRISAHRACALPLISFRCLPCFLTRHGSCYHPPTAHHHTHLHPVTPWQHFILYTVFQENTRCSFTSSGTASPSTAKTPNAPRTLTAISPRRAWRRPVR